MASNIKGLFVRFLAVFHDFSSVFTGGDFSEVSVVISLHFEVEHLGFVLGRFGDEEVVQEFL